VMFDINERVSYKVTVLCCNASARYRAPSAPIELYPRSSSVSI